MNIRFKKLTKSAKSPTMAYDGAAGMDLYADHKIVIPANTTKAVHTGLSFEIPTSYFGKIWDRSGFSLQNALKVPAGVIDSDYRGEIAVMFKNTGYRPYTIEPGDKIAQMVILRRQLIQLEELGEEEELTETARGDKGFGSSDSEQPS